MKQDIIIKEVTHADIPEITAYVQQAKKQLFPMLAPYQTSKDILEFTETYLKSPLGIFLQAKTSNKQLVGVIAMRAYDNRFTDLPLLPGVIVEVVHLFISPPYRRLGLASRLLETICKHAVKQKINVLYLHTHPFLEGAFSFWQKHDFNQISIQNHSGFETIHMQRQI